MIEVECECGRVIKTNDANAGKKARCPECGEIIQIPAPRTAGSKSPAAGRGTAGASVKAARKRPAAEQAYDGADDEFGDGEELPELPRSKKKGSKRSDHAADDEPAPKKKKKKKQGDADDGELNKKIVIGTCVVFGLAFLGMIGYGIANMGSVASGPKMEVPKEFADYASTNGELRCQGPKGWEMKTGGGSGGVPPFLTLEQGSVKIQFRSSPSGASLQMIAQAGGGDDKELPDEEKPVSKIHEMQKEKFLQEMSGYEEQGAPVMVQTASGEGRLSTFTASEGLLAKTFGYRCTLLGTNNQWIVTCKCTANDWKDFQPIFLKVLQSTAGS